MMNWLVAALIEACMKRGLAANTEPLGTKTTTGAAATPSPLSTALAASAAASAPPATLTSRLPLTAPRLVAVNCTLIWQLAPAARLKPQVLLWLKPALTLICSGEMALALELVRVKLRLVLCAPSVTLPKSQLLRLNASGASTTTGGGGGGGTTTTASPMPDTVTVSVPTFEVSVNVLLAAPTTVGLNTTL